MRFIPKMFRKSSDKILEEFKGQENAINQRRVELELESAQAQHKLNKAIAKAADAKREGNGIGTKEALVELAVERTEANQITRDRLMNTKSMSVVRLASRKIKTLMRDNKSNAVLQVAEIMSSKDVQELLGRHDIQVEECERRIESLFNINFEESKSTIDSPELQTEDEILIADLVAAQETGDEAEVSRIQSRLQGAEQTVAV